MRIMSYKKAGETCWGVVAGSGIVPSDQLGPEMPASLQEFMEQCEQDPGLVKATGSHALALPTQPVAELELLPCVPHPGKIVCLGVNYADHAKEGGRVVGDYPTVFLRCTTSLLGAGQAVEVPRISRQLDFEAELAVVIGKKTCQVSEQDALQAVFGYACFNDITLRDYQRKTTQWTIGKNFDATGAFGPLLVSADELPQGCTGLKIQSRLNGQVMQDANTEDMVFGVARTIALLSECMTLEAGDVLVMGTPGGVGFARIPPVWMKAGDRIEVEIEGLGVLSNPITAPRQ